MTDNITIQYACREQLPEIVNVRLAAQKDKVSKKVILPNAEELNTSYSQMLNSTSHRFLVATQEDAVVGIAAFTTKGELTDLYSIGPKGTGKKLLEGTEEICRRSKIKEISLTALPGSGGAFYRKNGYAGNGQYFVKSLQM